MFSTQDNMMQRGIIQSIFNYLPKSHIDFHIRTTRLNYSALVEYWKTIDLKGINNNRVLSQIKENLDDFITAGGVIKGYSDDFSDKAYSIQTPVVFEQGTIFSSIDPLTFVCQKCKKAHTFKTKNDYENKEGLANDCCKNNLKQIMFTFPCECGFCGSVWAMKCEDHPESDVFYDTNNYSFVCTKCSKRIEMKMKCRDCGKMLYPHAALDRSNLIAANLTLIDLLNSVEEHFLSSVQYGSNVIISKWLNKINETEYTKIISGKESANYELEQLRLGEKIAEYKEMGIDEDTAIDFANADMSTAETQTLITKTNKYIESELSISNKLQFNKVSNQILEYGRVMQSDSVCTINDIKQTIKITNPEFDIKTYAVAMGKMGFSNITFSGNIPFLLITYGFTRKKDDPSESNSSQPLTMRSFVNKDSDKINLYGVKMETEGIMFELDKKAIIRWLIKNKVISRIIAPDLKNENDLNRWFINNVNLIALSKFTNIDEQEHPITAYVYRLIHSISHALIRKAGICGLDTSSVGEYLLPNIPAFIIYCKDTGGISIGAIASLYKSHLASWLLNTFNDIDDCISDPICIERDKACNGCILVPSTTCQHQNKDLDRSLLCGYTEHSTGKVMRGFWK